MDDQYGAAPEQPVPEAADEKEMLRIRREKLAELQESGRDPFERVEYGVTADSGRIKAGFEQMDGRECSVAGRMMTKRLMGKASFCDIQDGAGRIQVYVRRDEVGEEPYAEFKRTDIGDILGVRGTVFRTHAGEISIKAAEITLLSKSLRIFPEKWHGLRDQETRYRQRYLDLIVNPDVKDVFVKRSAVISGIRRFLDNRGFLEVDTPVLQTIHGGGSARPFITRHNVLGLDMYERVALELPLKRLIVGGFERVYEIGRCFRNEGMDHRHNPEFTMLELYQAYTDYRGMMELIENMIKEIALKVTGSLQIRFDGHEIDLERPFEHITMVDAVKKYAGVDFDAIHSLDEARAAAKERGVRFEKLHEKGDILNLFFEEFAEKNLIQPTFLMDHPVEISPLTKKKPGKPGYTERFELFIAGCEYANAYSELNDPIDQRRRFERQEALRAAGDAEASMIDEDFLAAMEYGMPPTGGLGMGVDRFVMLLTDSRSIRDVLLFPTMRPV
ncbi:MAG: lysine--tRNA ligase [Firmicutes bacterium]|nr:lysine--tRNA ligase [Bacillota bacterium]